MTENVELHFADFVPTADFDKIFIKESFYAIHVHTFLSLRFQQQSHDFWFIPVCILTNCDSFI